MKRLVLANDEFRAEVYEGLKKCFKVDSTMVNYGVLGCFGSMLEAAKNI